MFKFLQPKRPEPQEQKEPELFSSFGYSQPGAKAEIKRYALGLGKDLGVPVFVDFAPLNKGVPRMESENPDGFIYGKCVRIFDTKDKDKPVGYHVYLDSTSIDSAKTMEELDDAFVQGIVTAGHELEHAEQFESKDREMALSHLASIGNPQNYRDNFPFNRREIAAEIAGIEVGHSYFRDAHPDKDADALLLRYVNKFADEHGTKDLDRTYFVQKSEAGEFTRLSDVIEALDSSYDAAKSHVNGYKYRVKDSCADDFAVLARSDRKTMMDALYDTHDSISSNTVLAAAAIKAHPDYYREVSDVESIHKSDFDPVVVFGKDVPLPKDYKPVDRDYGSNQIAMAISAAKQVEPGPDGPSYQP